MNTTLNRNSVNREIFENHASSALTEEQAVSHTFETIAELILFGLRVNPKPSKMTRVKDFIYKCKWHIVFYQENLGTEGFKAAWVGEAIKRYTQYLDINLDRLTTLEIERLEKLNSVSVFPKSPAEIIVAGQQAALDFYYGLEVPA
jgi:hypothetical protein